MDDLISRQAAIEVASRECHELRGVFSDIEHGLKELPSVQPRKGKWIDMGTAIDDDTEVKCSECGEVLYWMSNFCPNCGADMRGEEE